MPPALSATGPKPSMVRPQASVASMPNAARRVLVDFPGKGVYNYAADTQLHIVASRYPSSSDDEAVREGVDRLGV